LTNNNDNNDDIIDNKVLRELSKDFRRLGKEIDLYEDNGRRLASLVTACQKVAKSTHDFKVLAGLIDADGRPCAKFAEGVDERGWYICGKCRHKPAIPPLFFEFHWLEYHADISVKIQAEKRERDQIADANDKAEQNYKKMRAAHNAMREYFGAGPPYRMIISRDHHNRRYKNRRSRSRNKVAAG
jgi:hypothetical protein